MCTETLLVEDSVDGLLIGANKIRVDRGEESVLLGDLGAVLVEFGGQLGQKFGER